MIHSIIFDFGNVLGFFDHRRATSKLTAYTDLTSEAILAAVMQGTLEDDYESGRLTCVEFLKRVREQCRLRDDCSDALIASLYGDIFWPNEPVCALLPTLKQKYRLLLGSNTTELHARKFRQQFAEALGHFDELVLSYEIGVRKPKAGFFEHCQRLAGCAPSECLFIDDLPANIEGAKACGWNGIVFKDADDLRRRLVELGIIA